MSLDCDKGIRIAQVWIVAGFNRFLLLANETPNLIGLYVFHCNIANLASEQLFAFFSGQDQHVQDCLWFNFAETPPVARTLLPSTKQFRIIKTFSSERRTSSPNGV